MRYDRTTAVPGFGAASALREQAPSPRVGCSNDCGAWLWGCCAAQREQAPSPQVGCSNDCGAWLWGCCAAQREQAPSPQVGCSNDCGAWLWGCCAAQREQAPSPRGFVFGRHGLRINIDLRRQTLPNVTGVSKCVTKGATTGRCETPSPDTGRFRASPKISRHAVLAGLEGFANNGPAICSIDRFPFFCSCMNLRGCQCARTAFSVLL
ncbi:hypothetical protein SAMN03159429_02207 [Pseudomonas sp. NFACC51]|nr:hypothetical protein SAMN03159429_02207 [Pseudomonas sp. NFACC51]